MGIGDEDALRAENAKLKESNEALVPSYLQVDELSAHVGWLEAEKEELSEALLRSNALLREAREEIDIHKQHPSYHDRMSLLKRIDAALGGSDKCTKCGAPVDSYGCTVVDCRAMEEKK